MATTYRIEGGIVPNIPNLYPGLVQLAFLFRATPDDKVTMINNVSVANICAPNIGTGQWSYAMIASVPIITLNMRTIYNSYNSGSSCYNGTMIGKITGVTEAPTSVWYYVLYRCDPNTGIAYNTTYLGSTTPITVTIDDQGVDSSNITLVGSAIFGLGRTSYCDANSNLVRRMATPISLTQ